MYGHSEKLEATAASHSCQLLGLCTSVGIGFAGTFFLYGEMAALVVEEDCPFKFDIGSGTGTRVRDRDRD